MLVAWWWHVAGHSHDPSNGPENPPHLFQPPPPPVPHFAAPPLRQPSHHQLTLQLVAFHHNHLLFMSHPTPIPTLPHPLPPLSSPRPPRYGPFTSDCWLWDHVLGAHPSPHASPATLWRTPPGSEPGTLRAALADAAVRWRVEGAPQLRHTFVSHRQSLSQLYRLPRLFTATSG